MSDVNTERGGISNRGWGRQTPRNGRQGTGFGVQIVVDKDYDNDGRPVDDYGDDYGLRGEAL
jgi:hypothetical protein